MGAESEAVLAELCRQSFLSLWSYPSPFRDQGSGQSKEGKEICDLLVVFGNDIVIFSDKSCAFPTVEDLKVAWPRWYKRAVAKSVDQLFGAERWLKLYPERVFEDKECTKNLPMKLPTHDAVRVHRVAIAIGASERCRAVFGGSGTLRIDGGPPSGLDVTPHPFCVGAEGKPGQHVHVFDKEALHVVLREFDTASDFCSYLSAREALFAANRVQSNAERELVSQYMLTTTPAGHAFLPQHLETQRNIQFNNAHRTLQNFPGYHAAKEANRASYIWDKLIDHMTEVWRTGRSTEEIASHELEELLRLMASPERMIRRRLGAMLSKVLGHTDQLRPLAGSVWLPHKPAVAFAVVTMHKPAAETDDHRYLQKRRTFAVTYARSLRMNNPAIEQVITYVWGRSSDGAECDELLSEDVRAARWTPTIEQETRDLVRLLGISIEQPTLTPEYEYPDANAPGEVDPPPYGYAPRSGREERKPAKFWLLFVISIVVAAMLGCIAVMYW
jgi:hypothetical protein